MAIYTDIDGDWFEALQFPVPVQNRLVIDNRPLIGPLHPTQHGPSDSCHVPAQDR